MTRRKQRICGLLEGGRVMREILWKKIDGYDYAVSTSGEVKRLATKASSGTGNYERQVGTISNLLAALKSLQNGGLYDDIGEFI